MTCPRFNGRPKFNLLKASVAQRLPFVDDEMGLVFTCGALIHIAPADLRRAIREVFRVSSKYVLIMEYAADKETVIPYHGQEAALWVRDWPREVNVALAGDFRIQQQQQYEREWQLTWTCPLGKDQGFDDVTAYLYERKSE